MENFETTDTQKVSKYNAAGDQLKRLTSLYDTAHRRVLIGDYLSWNILLDRVWLELAGDLDEKSPEEKKMEEFNQKITKLMPLNSSGMHGFDDVPKKSKEKVSEQYIILCEKEKFIRRLQNKLGKGTAWRDEFEDDF